MLTVDVLRAVVRPAITAVEGVEVLDVAVQSLLRELSSVFLQPQIGEYSKPEPVCVRHAGSQSVKVDHGYDGLWYYFFSLIELPSQFSTFDFSFCDMDPQISGATARAKPFFG